MIVLLVCTYVVYVDVCLYSDCAVAGNALNALLRWLYVVVFPFSSKETDSAADRQCAVFLGPDLRHLSLQWSAAMIHVVRETCRYVDN